MGLGKLHKIRTRHFNLRVAPFPEKILPLPDHPEKPVVDDEYFDGQLVLDNRGQFLGIHLEPAITADGDDRKIGAGKGNAHRRGKRETHRSETTRGDKGARFHAWEELRRPHLMLTNIGNDNCRATGNVAKAMEHLLGTDLRSGLVPQWMLALPPCNLQLPCSRIKLPDEGEETRQHTLHITHNRHIHKHVLADRRRIDVDMHYGRFRGERLNLAGDTIVEPGADRNQYVAMVDRHVGVPCSVHPQHPHRERIVGRESPQALKSGRHRAGHFAGKSREFRRSPREHHATAHVEHRTFCSVDHLRGLLQLLLMSFNNGIVAPHLDSGGIIERCCMRHDVLRQIHKHGSRSPGGRNVERFFDCLRKFRHIAHKIVVFGDRKGDADNVGLLECIIPDQAQWHLSGEDHEWQRIHVCIGDSRHGVRGPGTGRHKDHPRLACHPRISLRCMSRTLLMPCEDVLDSGEVAQHIVHADRCSSGIPEEHLDFLLDERANEDLRSCHDGTGSRSAIAV